MKLVNVFKHDSSGVKYMVDLSLSYHSDTHGFFTQDQDNSFKFSQFRDLTQVQAESIANLTNAAYQMGYARAKREIAKKLGL